MSYNNVYLLDYGKTRVLVDTGPDYLGAAEVILQALEGASPDLVVATHGHLDHAGLGAWWQSRGVPVALGEADRHLTREPQLADPAELAAFEAYAHDLGAPTDLVLEVLEGLRRRRDWASDAARDQPHRPGGDGRWPSQLRYRHFEPERSLFDGDGIPGTTLEVIHCPGHTPGNLVLFDTAEGWLFSGDQLLPEITPTPAIQASPLPAPGHPWRFHSLPNFLDSMLRIRDLDAATCWPGHGEPFANVGEVITENIAQIEKRTERVLMALKRHGSVSAYVLAADLYPRALARRFWQIIATVQGHLDLLEEREMVTGDRGIYTSISNP